MHVLKLEHNFWKWSQISKMKINNISLECVFWNATVFFYKYLYTKNKINIVKDARLRYGLEKKFNTMVQIVLNKLSLLQHDYHHSGFILKNIPAVN